MKDKKNTFWSSTSVLIITLFILALLADIMNTYGDKLRYRKVRLKQDIEILHTKYIDLYKELSKYILYGDIDKEIKARNLNLTRGNHPPYIIYVDKKQK